MTAPFRRILVVMAMGVEAAPVIEALAAEQVAAPPEVGPLPVRWFATAATPEVLVTVNGTDARFGVANIATQPAAVNAYAAALHWKPDLIVSAGTAGGWASKGAAIGDLFVGQAPIVYHDRRIALPGFDAYGIGSYPCLAPGDLLDVLDAKSGRVTTSNSLDETDEDRRMIAANGGDVKEMEAAAVAWVAELFHTPMIAVKAITDLVDSPVHTATQFEANLAQATARLADAMPSLVRWAATAS